MRGDNIRISNLCVWVWGGGCGILGGVVSGAGTPEISLHVPSWERDPGEITKVDSYEATRQD